MKRKVVIEFEVDPTEYHNAVDTSYGTLELVKTMLKGEADLPPFERISIVAFPFISQPGDKT